MNNIDKLNPRSYTVAAIILFGALMRLIPHWPNFTPIAAIALFGGAYFEKKHHAFAITFAALLISDLILGFHQWMLAVYMSFAIIVSLGFLLQRKVRVWTMIGASLSASLVFYIITNFAVWIASPYYPQNLAGLIECYTLALPFLKNGILGDMFYSAVLFGGFYLAQKRFPVLRKVHI